ncbi:D-alanine--D-serine ligase VanG [Gehongia tenuis]|uniref:D-alanine--D-alanine ligase n=1 Tax=Gehongia tenuis TaxID=2763655 RepID=A0A926D4K1_9FIRM|nr:D-alanine--D-serine ligase VanG [Gehongia tenuis]
MLKNIAVLFGGCSTEYEVSLQSASAVLKAINPDKYQVFPLGITREGEWFLYSGPLAGIRENRWWRDEKHLERAVLSPDRHTHGLTAAGREIRLDGVFPVLHGKNGEDGTVQGLAELAGIPVIGCDLLSSALCMDKAFAHEVVERAGIPVPASVVLHEDDWRERLPEIEGMAYPLFIKPSRSGSSIGITRVEEENGLVPAIQEAFIHDNKVLVEAAVKGFEVGCAILGGRELVVGEVDEIELTHGFFNYGEKYTLATSRIHTPARLEKSVRQHIQRMAERIYRILGCSGFARVDLFWTGKEAVFNEVNTIPGCTEHSRYPAMMKAVGLDFPAMIEKLIAVSLEESHAG